LLEVSVEAGAYLYASYFLDPVCLETGAALDGGDFITLKAVV
jgi:hypothetical protein